MPNEGERRVERRMGKRDTLDGVEVVQRIWIATVVVFILFVLISIAILVLGACHDNLHACV